jgi:hypothetical protein
MSIKSSVFLLILYFLSNVIISKRLKKAYYPDKAMLSLHLKLIWLLPFIGPLMLYSFWKTSKPTKLKINTKENRKTESSQFYESGEGLNF